MSDEITLRLLSLEDSGLAVCLMYNYTQSCPRGTEERLEICSLTGPMATLGSERTYFLFRPFEGRKESSFQRGTARRHSMPSHEGGLHYASVVGRTVTVTFEMSVNLWLSNAPLWASFWHPLECSCMGRFCCPVRSIKQHNRPIMLMKWHFTAELLLNEHSLRLERQMSPTKFHSQTS